MISLRQVDLIVLLHKCELKPLMSVAVGIALLGSFLCLPQVADAQTLQRLFTTSAQRLELNRLRQGNNSMESLSTFDSIRIEAISAPILEEQSEEQNVPDLIYALQGIVRSGDEHYTVWLNNSPVDHTALPENVELLIADEKLSLPNRLLISNLDNGAEFTLVPGQVLNLSRGQLLESYQIPVPTISVTASTTVPTAVPTTVSTTTGITEAEAATEVPLSNAAADPTASAIDPQQILDGMRSERAIIQ